MRTVERIGFSSNARDGLISISGNARDGAHQFFGQCVVRICHSVCFFLWLRSTTPNRKACRKAQHQPQNPKLFQIKQHNPPGVLLKRHKAP